MFERVRKYVQTLKTDNLTLAFEYSKEKKNVIYIQTFKFIMISYQFRSI